MGTTALQHPLAAAGARFSEYGGAVTAASFGDLAAEVQALRRGCGVYDLGWRARLLVTGEDRVRWLNGMVTNNVRDLAPGQGAYCFLLSAQGRILGDMYAYMRADRIELLTEQAQVEKLLAVFDKFIIMDDVTISRDPQFAAIGALGPQAAAPLEKAGLPVADLKPLQFADIIRDAEPLTVARGPEELGAGFEIWLSPAAAPALWDSLLAAGATAVGSEAVEMYRILSGVPRYGQDIRERDLPQETGQARALNFSKGCYVGQEIVERIRSRGQVRRQFHGFLIEGPAPAPGTHIQADGKEVGEITSVASVPDGGPTVALGYIRREALAPHAALRAGEAAARPVRLPLLESRVA